MIPLNPQPFETELRGNILPFWMQHTLDRENGGFYGAVSNDLRIHNEVERSAVLCSRILWTFSTAFRLYGEETYLRTAQWAFDYLSSRFWDAQYQGIYWSLDRRGQPLNDRKHTYAQAFSIYGFSAYYQATRQPESLALAQQLFDLLETHTFDAQNGGNIECCSREWGALQDMRLSQIDFNSRKSMNTLLHLLEGYTNLARVWPAPDSTSPDVQDLRPKRSDKLSDRLRGLIQVFLEHIIDPSTGRQRLFFDDQWTSLSEMISYGHDIEASWLLVEAAEALGDPALLSRARTTSLAMAQAVYDQALRPDGSLLYEVVPGAAHANTERHWWAHAEAVVGFYNAYQLSGQAHFVRAAAQVWEYIQAHFIDRQHGDWFKLLDAASQPAPRHKAGPWDCPYHHARLCFEMIRRCDGENRGLLDLP